MTLSSDFAIPKWKFVGHGLDNLRSKHLKNNLTNLLFRLENVFNNQKSHNLLFNVINFKFSNKNVHTNNCLSYVSFPCITYSSDIGFHEFNTTWNFLHVVCSTTTWNFLSDSKFQLLNCYRHKIKTFVFEIGFQHTFHKKITLQPFQATTHF